MKSFGFASAAASLFAGAAYLASPVLAQASSVTEVDPIVIKV